MNIFHISIFASRTLSDFQTLPLKQELPILSVLFSVVIVEVLWNSYRIKELEITLIAFFHYSLYWVCV